MVAKKNISASASFAKFIVDKKKMLFNFILLKDKTSSPSLLVGEFWCLDVRLSFWRIDNWGMSSIKFVLSFFKSFFVWCCPPIFRTVIVSTSCYLVPLLLLLLPSNVWHHSRRLTVSAKVLQCIWGTSLEEATPELHPDFFRQLYPFYYFRQSNCLVIYF